MPDDKSKLGQPDRSKVATKSMRRSTALAVRRRAICSPASAPIERNLTRPLENSAGAVGLGTNSLKLG